MLEKFKWGAVIAVSMVLGGAVVVAINETQDDDPAPQTVVIEPASSQEDSGGQISNQESDSSDDESEPAPASSASSDLADLYEEIRPSVVRINASDTGIPGGGGVGSGIVLDEDGHILTNHHVVGEFDNVDVIFWDGTAVEAQLVGSDPGNDLAVIRADVSADVLVPAAIGDSDNLRVGERVVAVGNPFDLEGSITEGIVSGIGRSLSSGGGRPLRQLIQADAAVNPGNSGGGLFNERGEVVGITTAIENPSGSRVFAGIGYAVPVNTATRFLPQMLAGETVQHPRLGIALQDVTPSLAETLGLSVDQGVLVQSVEPGSAADAAGMQGGTSGDVIVSIDGETITSFEDLANFIDSKQVGDVVEVTVVRGGDEVVLTVTLEPWQST